MQSNFCSILGKYGSKAKLVVKKLLENDMVHFLGSDVHKQNTIYPNINLAIKKITEIIGEEKLLELTTTNPELVLKNKTVDFPEPKQIKLNFIDKIKLSKTNI